MTFSIPSDAELWEVVAGIQVCQAYQAEAQTSASSDAMDLLDEAGFNVADQRQGIFWLDTARAYRAAASAQIPYPAVLANVSGLKEAPMKSPVLRKFRTTSMPLGDGGVVFAPHEVVEAFKMPFVVWKAIVKHLRSYGRPVRFLGRSGERGDYAGFTEGSVLSNLAMRQRLLALAAADLVVGVPNEWTWLAAGMGKKVVVLHPEDIPHARWFGFEVQPRTLGRILYDARQLQVPVILAGMRRMIEAM